MTIFLEIAQQVLQQKGEAICAASDAADRSVSNYTVGLFGLGRDTSLSLEKQGLVRELLASIAEKAAVEDEPDEATLLRLQTLIAACRDATTEKSRAKGYPEGAVEEGLRQAAELLRSIYGKLQKVDLLDKPHNTEPLNCLRYHAALYFAEKIYDQQNPSLLDQLKMHPKVGGSTATSDLKDALLTEALGRCSKEWADLFGKTDDRERADSKQDFILGHIARLHEANRALCAEGVVTVSIPSLIDIRCKAFQPEEGFLKTCLERATAEIMAHSEPRAAMASFK